MERDASARWGWTSQPLAAPKLRLDLLAFDCVRVGDRLLTPEEFLGLPIDRRIELNVAGKLVFLKSGQLVRARDAMRSLMSASAA